MPDRPSKKINNNSLPDSIGIASAFDADGNEYWAVRKVAERAITIQMDVDTFDDIQACVAEMREIRGVPPGETTPPWMVAAFLALAYPKPTSNPE